MLAIRLPQSIENRLEKLAERTSRTKTYYVRLAIEQFLEDQEDYLLAVSRLEKKTSSLSLKSLEKKLGLANKSKQRRRKRD
ncbi:MAG TPA: TraY domain-containing protein [Gammaproteobacteria bacterium]|nr:TraY domain-containing protein [Gammaproteobacteria bacterium]